MRDRVPYILSIFLSLYGLLSFSYLWHEVGHGIGAGLAGGSFDGITFELPDKDQLIWISYPLVEKMQTARPWATAGGLLATLCLGFFGLGLSRVRRASLLPVLLVLATLGHLSGALLAGVVLGGPRDFYRLMGYGGVPREAAAWIAALIGLPGCLVLGMWCLRRLREPPGRRLGTRPGCVLFLDLAIPLLLTAAFELSGLWWWASALGLVPIVLMPWSPHVLRKQLLMGSALALGSFALFWVAVWVLAPRPVSRSSIEKRTMGSPADAIVLRRGAFDLFRLATSTGDEVERASLIEQGRALRARAIELAPESAGANFDWAMSLVAEGDSLSTQGQGAGARDRWLDALPYLREAYGRDPRNKAIVEHLANHYEKLGETRRAGLFYNLYSQLIEEDGVSTSSTERHQRVSTRRAKAMERLGRRRASGPGDS